MSKATVLFIGRATAATLRAGPGDVSYGITQGHFGPAGERIIHQTIGAPLITHNLLINAFTTITDKNALAWCVIDTKSELFVSAAIALAANRRAGARIAHVEYPPRVDLVFKGEDGRVAMAYSAKAGYVTDFQPGRIAKEHRYLGAHLDEDLGKLPGLCSRLGAEVRGAAVFYLYEVSEPSKQTKYADKFVDLELAVAALVRFVPKGTMVAREVLDCGIADGASVRIHLCVFDPVSRNVQCAESVEANSTTA